MLDRLYRTLKDLEHINAYKNKHALPQNILEGFYDDLNTPKVIAELNILSNKVTRVDDEEKSLIKYCLLETGKIMGILQQDAGEWLGYGKSKNLEEETIEGLIKDRNEARRNKNFQMADSIRKKLKESGIEIEDTSDGTIWRSN